MSEYAFPKGNNTPSEVTKLAIGLSAKSPLGLGDQRSARVSRLRQLTESCISLNVVLIFEPWYYFLDERLLSVGIACSHELEKGISLAPTVEGVRNEPR